jgi:general secretion pathway protein H
MIAALAAILLASMPRGTSQPRLEAYAMQVATLLKGDRNAALQMRGAVLTRIDATARLINSGSSNRLIRVPDDVIIDALLPKTCNGRPMLSTIIFFASGMSCGGVIRLTRLGSGFDVRVNWLTGGIEIERSIL